MAAATADADVSAGGALAVSGAGAGGWTSGGSGAGAGSAGSCGCTGGCSGARTGGAGAGDSVGVCGAAGGGGSGAGAIDGDVCAAALGAVAGGGSPSDRTGAEVELPSSSAPVHAGQTCASSEMPIESSPSATRQCADEIPSTLLTFGAVWLTVPTCIQAGSFVISLVAQQPPPSGITIDHTRPLTSDLSSHLPSLNAPRILFDPSPVFNSPRNSPE